MKKYDPKQIEPKWQQIWAETKLYRAVEKPSSEKSYVIDMFPYPSGAGLHVGHVRNFSISDTYALYQRQLGKNVLRTVGFDAFGLPTENYAIKTGISPQDATAKNVDIFKGQLEKLGMSYDWDRQVLTSDPDYYRWTQWIFLQMLHNGLAYQKENLQWWCDHDQTVLADEQVVNGRCWRCDNPVVKKSLKQWFFKITDYADRLLDGLEDLDWPEKIKSQQRNWIGRSVGAQIKFEFEGSENLVEVFTTRPDTIFGATYLVLAPEHELVEKVTTAEHRDAVNSYVKSAAAKSDIERMETDRAKTGVFTGARVINPATKKIIPVWVADYVLAGYGTGAIMAVPAHDQRDFEFANKFELPVVEVIEAVTGTPQPDPEFRQSIVAIVEHPETGDVLTINWGRKLGGTLFVGGGLEKNEDQVEAAIREITEETGYKNLSLKSQTGTIHHHYFAHSKNQERQIEAVGLHFILENDDRVDQKLDTNEVGKFEVEWLTKELAGKQVKDPLHSRVFEKLVLGRVYTGEGLLINSGEYSGADSAEARDKMASAFGQDKVNYKMRDWLISRQRYWGAPIPVIHCDKCGTVPVPDDQLPVVLPPMESYEPSGDGRSALARATDWLSVDCPKCGGKAERETDTMDGYACSSWYFLRYLDPNNSNEAFNKKIADYWMPVDVYVGGDHAVAHLLYARFWTMFFKDQGLLDIEEPFKALRYNGYILATDGRKMSKSFGNVVDPLDLINEGYGADALRLYELFIGPYDQNVNWNPTGIDGTKRFLNRVFAIVQEHLETAKTIKEGEADDIGTGNATLETAVASVIHRATRKVTQDLEHFAFNTAIAAMMEAVNELYRLKTELPLGTRAWENSLKQLILILAPFAPHISEELWRDLGADTSVHNSNWPAWDSELVKEELVTLVVQVNGRVRATLELTADSSEDQAVAAANEQESVKKQLEGKKILKTIFVKNKILNFVVK
jgi:leucyl-tRNA synthetase